MSANRPLLAFFVKSMLALGAAILVQFDAIGIVTLVLHGHVIFAFAAAANQSDLFTHNITSLKKADQVGFEDHKGAGANPPPQVNREIILRSW